MRKFKIADMHTHSESSHDSVAGIEDMYEAESERGTCIFAVTDHFDTASFSDYDCFSPIKAAHEEVLRLNKDGKRILLGIEISEGFWYPDVSKQAIEMLDYDVIIGSVHLVRYKDLSYAYSKIDFSILSVDTVAEYVDAYFDDVLTMIDTVDFDVLAHLTNPLKYISGKYKIELDLTRYEVKIDKILQRIVEKGIALELNTSGEFPDIFIPSLSILKSYYDMGGRLLTLGSDAHVTANASRNFDRAICEIKKIGFDSIYYYENRKAVKIEI